MSRTRRCSGRARLTPPRLARADVAILVDIGSSYFSEHEQNVKRHRNVGLLQQAANSIANEDCAMFVRDLDAIHAALDTPGRRVHVFYVPDGRRRPIAKKYEVRRRKRRRKKARGRTKMACGSPPESFSTMTGLRRALQVRFSALCLPARSTLTNTTF